MKIAYRLFLFLLISAFLFGCSEKKAGIEGKVLDGRGQPISGITVIFKQVKESKGYEQFETKTLANGVFRIDGVMPASEYIITPVPDNWKTKVTTKITTLSEGQNLVLSNPIVIRYNALKDGTVVDTKTGLQWLILGITDLNSSNVLNSVKNIKEAGFTDWRLPTKEELLQVQETSAAPATQSETVLVQKTCCVWVTEPNSENVEWKFYVDDGNDVWASSKVPPDDRIVVVRNYIPTAPSTQPSAAATPASDTAAPSANLPAEKKPATEPAAPVMQKKDIPVVKSDDGVLRASRKACLANKGKPAKSPATEAPSVVASPAKQSPSARVKTPAQPDNSIGNSVTIQFDMNKSIISPEELSKLKAFYAKIKGKKGRIVIEGNSNGGEADNFKISGDRALSVKSMLHKLGLSKKVDVKIVGLSDTKPIAENTTEAGRILNRRADITFIPGSPATAALPTKQSPSAIVTTHPVKSEGGVLRASRKACIAKKAQTAK
jgi:OOP family OmpA-OmpF porin